MKRFKRWASMLAATTVLTVVVLIGSFYATPLPERLNVAGSSVMYWEDGRPAHVFLSPDEKWRIRVALDEVDPTYVEALVRLEDKRFYSHFGVDPIALMRAVISNVTSGRVVSGASTITMQVVRVLEPRPRTLKSKAIEAWRAMQLEWFLSKEELLETYLNHVPYGRNVEGIEAASLAYFGHRSDALSADEVATLLAVPQNPNRRYPKASNLKRLEAGRNEIAAFLLEKEAMALGGAKSRISAGELLEHIRATSVPDALTPMPRSAPHLAYWLRDSQPGQQRFYTTLDESIQGIAERQMLAKATQLQRQGIDHGVSIIIDHETAEVRALVGSFDFWSGQRGTQIPMFNVPRSPGSALKPYIYAMAIERGLILPEHLVLDIPATYRGYAPKNFDGTFSGLVSAEESLSRSLNLPFVFLLQKLGIEEFTGHLGVLGVDSLREEPGYYGLSVAAGGIEMTPLELAGLYVTLARMGQYKDVRWLKSDVLPSEMKVFSEGAMWLTQRALAIKDRPDFPSRRSLNQMPASIHWKTGTSFGHKDAWAAGSGPKYTALVWLGNADQRSSRALVGAEASGPILFNLLDALGKEEVVHVPPPQELIEVEVCAYSGHLAHEACPHRRTAMAIETQVPTTECPFHVTVEVDQDSGEAVGPGCRADRRVAQETFVRWPASVRRWLGDEHRRLPEIPRYADDCDVGGEQVPPRLVSPQAGQVTLLIPGVSPEKQEVPLEADSVRHGMLTWFVDGLYLGEAMSDDRMWWVPSPGRHQVVVIDETGASDSRWFEVKDKL